jgi:hypothetical protein
MSHTYIALSYKIGKLCLSKLLTPSSIPQTYMFGQMRSALSITKGTDILDHIYTFSPTEQEVAFQKIRDIESTAMVSNVRP